MKYLFFVTTFGSIYNRVLPLLEQIDADITVVASTPNIYKFFTECTPYKTLLLPVRPEFFSHKFTENLHSFFGLRKFKRKLPKEDVRIYFFGDSWQLSVYTLIRKLARRNYVHQFISTDDSSPEKKLEGFKYSCLTFLIKLLTGVDADICKENDVEYIRLSSKFYKKNQVFVHQDEVEPLPLKNKYTRYFSFNGADVMLAIEDIPRYERISEVEYTSTMNKVCSILEKHIDASRLRVKQHPNQTKTYGRLKELPQIEQYIPSELCMSHSWKVVIGAESHTLLHATRLSHDAVVISLLNLLSYTDDSVRSYFIDWFKQHSDKILFPKTFEEFEEILCNVL